MRICIYGAGASGGHFAVRLARAGHDVSVVARGPHLAAIRHNGLALRTGDDLLTVKVAAGSEPRDFGTQDVVIVTTKTTALPAIAAQIAPLVGTDTLVVFTQNGMTWWYPHGLSPRYPKPPALPIFDLAGPFLSTMRGDQVVGGLIYSANEIEAPGIVRNDSPTHNRLEVGPIDGRETEAIAVLRQVLNRAEILSPDPGDIRAAVWMKLLLNMSGSAIALATGSRSDAARTDDALAEIYRRIVREGLAVSAAHGYPLGNKLDPDETIGRLLHRKPSILQDYEQRRPMEIAEIMLAPVAFARAQDVATPTLDALAAIVTKMARDRGLLPADVAGPELSSG